MPSCSARAASCARSTSPSGPESAGKAACRSVTIWRSVGAFVFITCFLQVGLAQVGDAVGRAATSGGLATVEQSSDFGVGEISEVAVDDRASLLRRKRIKGRPQFGIGVRRVVPGRSVGQNF